MEEEKDEKRALPLTRQLEQAAFVLDLEGPQDAVFAHVDYL